MSEYEMNRGFDSLAAELLHACTPLCPAPELEFYERRIRSNGGPALDQACGTGRHLLPLLERGLDVHGADASADALRAARQQAEERGLSPRLYRQTMEDLDVPHRYGTIYIPNASFQLVDDRETALRTLVRFREHLAPGGQLLVELFVPDEATGTGSVRDAEHPERWTPEKRPGEEGEITAELWTDSFDLFEQTLVEKRRYELLVDGEVVRSEVHTLRERWYYRYEFTMMLEQAGFEEIYPYADHSERAATNHSQLIVYGARSPRG